jgi:hypothetical protein
MIYFDFGLTQAHCKGLFDSLRSKIWESSGELSSVMILDPATGNSLEIQYRRQKISSHEQ